MSELDQSLKEAYELIEEGNLDSARSILEPIIETDNNNVDAWWLYIHATDDPKQAQKALKNVERLDSNYPGLADLSSQLNQTIASNDTSDEPEVSDDWEDDDFEIEEDSSEGRRIPILPLAMVGLLILAIVIIFSVMQNQDSDDTADPTPLPTVNVATLPTFAMPTVEVTDAISPTEILQVPESRTITPSDDATQEVETTAEASTAGEFQDVVTALGDIVLAEEPPQIITLDLGATLLVSVCSDPALSLRDQITNAMVALSSASETVTDIDALAVRVYACENNNEIVNTLGVSLTQAQSFTQGDISESEFRSEWRVVN